MVKLTRVMMFSSDSLSPCLLCLLVSSISVFILELMFLGANVTSSVMHVERSIVSVFNSELLSSSGYFQKLRWFPERRHHL